jgi:RNA polymerase sigma-70 factor (ECF subfamily)
MSQSSFTTVELQGYIDRLRSGDGQGADALLRRTCARLERLARRMLRSFPNVKRWADTDDVLQGALIRLLRTLQAVRPPSTQDFFNLAATHLRRELLDLARKFRHRCERSPTIKGSGETDALEAAAAPEGGDDLDLWCAFHEQVARLPPEEREVVGLMFYHGWHKQQVAELLGVDQRTVRRRWLAAGQLLSAALGGRLPTL